MMFKSQIAFRRPGPKYRTKDMHDPLGPERWGRLRGYTGPVLESLHSPCVGDLPCLLRFIKKISLFARHYGYRYKGFSLRVTMRSKQGSPVCLALVGLQNM